MLGVAVIRLRDIVKWVLAIIIAITMIFFAKKYFGEKDLEKINIGQKVSSSVQQYIQKAVDIEMPGIKQVQGQSDNEMLIDESTDNEHEGLEMKLLNTMIGLELGAINVKEENIKVANSGEDISGNQIEENISQEGQNNNKNHDEEEKNENIELANTNVKTEVVTKNPIADSYTKKYNGVKIKNETSFDLSDDILNSNKLKINKSNIIIFHTHTCESYTSSEKYSYTPTGKFRTTDLNYSVARVGDELTKYLKKYNINVVHDKTYHDYPSYSGSYTRSLSTVSNLLKKTNADIIIDLHRDAIGSNSSYAPTVKIGEDYCAQLMFVMGSNGGGLNHPNWQTNLQFAVKMQELANKTYPGLFKPIILRNSRYNQHLGNAACIIEVGSTGNTLEQCLNSMKYLSEIINEF